MDGWSLNMMLLLEVLTPKPELTTFLTSNIGYFSQKNIMINSYSYFKTEIQH